MDYLSMFQMPKPIKITGRSSSITSGFVTSIITAIYPRSEEIRKSLEILRIEPGDLSCAYCGSLASEWDRSKPLVKDKRPTGYISGIHNLVQSCGKCNQSKGNKTWNQWMCSPAKQSPKNKRCPRSEQSD